MSLVQIALRRPYTVLVLLLGVAVIKLQFYPGTDMSQGLELETA